MIELSVAEKLNRRELKTRLSTVHLDLLFATANNGKISLFKLLDLLITKEYIRKDFRSEFYQSHFDYFEGSKLLTLKQMGEQHKLSREHFRKLRETNLKDFSNHFAFIKLLQIDDDFFMDSALGVIYLSPEHCKEINKKAGTRFTTTFITKILAVLVKDGYELIGEENLPGRNGWKHLYLIKRDLKGLFNFEKFINVIKERSRNVDRRTEISLDSLLNEFKLGDISAYREQISDICKNLIEHEIGSNLCISGQVIFLRTKKMQVWEYVEEALKIMPVARLGYLAEDIHKVSKKQYPDLKYDNRSFIAAMKNPIFIHFSKTSHFGLKEWEKSGKIKGGTIQEILIEFLENSSTPVHLLHMTDYIQRFRDTDLITIDKNLESRKHDRFVLFKGGYRGLIGKEYPTDWDEYDMVSSTSYTWANMKAMENTPLAEVRKKLMLHPKNSPQIDAVLREKLAKGEIEIGDHGELIVREWEFQKRTVVDKSRKKLGIDIKHTYSITPAVFEVSLRSESEQELAEQELLVKTIIDMDETVIKKSLEEINKSIGEKIEIQSRGYSRNAYAILLIKKLRGYRCQICPAQILKKDGSYYIEAAHITAKKFNGKENLENIIILCPNCHKTFDFGDLRIVERSSSHLSFLLNDISHQIELYVSDSMFA